MSQDVQEQAGSRRVDGAQVEPAGRRAHRSAGRRWGATAAALVLAVGAGWWLTRAPAPGRQGPPDGGRPLRVGEGFNETMAERRRVAEGALSSARAHLQAEDAAAAVADVDAALGLHPDPPPPFLVAAHTDRGLARALLGDPQAAGEDVDLALQLEPRSVRALRFRALLRVDRGDPAGAADDLEQALRLAPAAPWTDEARAQVARLRSGAWTGGAREELVAFARSGSD